MQLKHAKVKSALLMASCSLLTGNVRADKWTEDLDVETAVMYYGEADRVQAVEGIVQVKKDLSNDRELSAKLVVDSLTGSSANGAVPQQAVQTFSSPSGNKEFEVGAEEIPLDSTFRDTRLQLSGQWLQPVESHYTLSGGLNVSREYDYQSIAFNGVIARNFNMKNSTLSLGLSYSIDSIGAVGGRPVGLSTMVVKSNFLDDESYNFARNRTRQSGDGQKQTSDIVFGLTQVVSRRWITQLNFGFSEVEGYLTDPYKVISSVDSTGKAMGQYYEHRPDTRSKQFFYGQSKYHFSNSIWDISYRLTNDDWGIQSQTLETRYKFMFAHYSLEPHLRMYRQEAADFYQPFLLGDGVVPKYVSADYRIGKLDAVTIGFRYGRKLKSGNEFGTRVEYYSQSPQDIGVNAPGQLKDLDLYPSLDAIIFQFDYKF